MGGSAVTLACAARAASESGLQVPAAAVRLEERQQIASRHVDEDKARFYKQRRQYCRSHWRITNTSQTHDPGMMFVFRATNVHGQGSVPLPCMPLCSILAFYNKIRNRVDIDLTCGDPPLYVILGLDPGTRLVNGKVKAWSSFLQVRWKKGAEWKTFKAGDDGRVRAACLRNVSVLERECLFSFLPTFCFVHKRSRISVFVWFLQSFKWPFQVYDTRKKERRILNFTTIHPVRIHIIS
jgi:hypothetical protein